MPVNVISMVCSSNWTSTASCNSVIRFSCVINDTFSNSQGINAVTFFAARPFSVQSDTIDGTLLSGTAQNGIWYADYVVTPRDETAIPGYDKYELTMVTARNSVGQYCDPVDNYDGPSCKATFDAYRDVSTSCVCNNTAVYGSCGTNDLRNISSLGSACSSSSLASSLMDCDYCNPLWMPQYNTCAITDYSRMAGTATKTYGHGVGTDPNGSTCCGHTNYNGGAGYSVYRDSYGGGSDCDQPADHDSAVSCALDSWLSSGNNPSQMQYNDVHTGFSGQEYGQWWLDNMQETSVANGPDNNRKPLVFDLDGDGANELIFTKGQYVYVYSLVVGVLTLEASYNAGSTIYGQFSTYGVDRDDATGVYSCSDHSVGTACATNFIWN